MAAQEFSPNWYWAMLGFTIHRDAYRRTIFDWSGRMVCDMASYDCELSICEWLYHGAIINPLNSGD